MFEFLRRRRASRSPAKGPEAEIPASGSALGGRLRSASDSAFGGRLRSASGSALDGQLRSTLNAGEAARAGAPALDPDALLRRLEWTVVRRLDGMLQGDYRTLFRGHGFDLADLREYQPSDDVRFIDWNVTARLQVAHVRQHQEDREVAAWMLLDLSGSVGFGSGKTSKRMLAASFCAVMARLLAARGNRVGARLLTDSASRIEVLMPRTGRPHLLHMIDRIAAAHARGGESDETDLGRLLADAQRGIARRSSVFVLSDFISRPGWESALGLLAQRHDVVAVRLFDPLEQQLPDLGLIALRDAETDELIWVDSGDASFRARFAQLADERERNLRTAFAKAGVDCLELATDEDLGDSLSRFVRLRKRRAQLASGATPTAHTAGGGR